MALVTNQTELNAALTQRDPLIQVAADFSINSQVTVSYSVALESISTDVVHVITKDANYYGYMIRISDNGSLSVRNLVIDGDRGAHDIENTANRSLINVSGGALTLGNGAVIENNYSYIEGGGVYLSGNNSYTNTFVMEDDAQIRGCSSRTAGGGMIAALRNNEDRVVIRGNALFTDNSSASGGGLYYRSYLEGVGVPLTIGDNVSFLNNTASANGGGIYISGFAGDSGTATPVTLSENVRIQNNQANHGGGIYYNGTNDGDGLTISGAVSISENRATNNGGGINVTAVSGTLSVSLAESSIERNQGGVGGGIYINSAVGGDFTFDSFTVRNNNSRTGSGGGIWLGTNTTASNPFTGVFDNLTLLNNISAGHGGGLYFQSASSPLSLVMENCDISGNTAVQSGGGLLFNASGGMRITNSQINGNTAGQSGGGYYFNTNQNIDSTIIMTQVTVNSNRTQVSGGGLRLGTGGGTLLTTLTDSIIEDNNAVSSGGGIWNGGANASITINGNSQILRNATQSGNGGGIYFNSSTGGTLILDEETKISYNTADTTPSASGNLGGGVCVVPGLLTIRGNTEISNNSALRAGGGVSLAETTVANLESGSIYENRTQGVGGGIYNTAGSRANINGMQVHANQASIGGGIYNRNGGIVFAGQDSVINGSVPNSATLYASGIYNDAIVETADRPNIGNGLYLTNRNAAAQILRPMASPALIQLDISDYVSPNSQGTPIVVADGTAEYPILSQQDAEAFLKPTANFDGWEIRLSDDSTQVWLAPIVYKITYENLMGATHSNQTEYLITSPTITLEAPTPISGYRFVGWFASNGTEVTQIPTGSMGDLVLYAVWDRLNYTIRYLPNDAGGYAAENIPDSILVAHGESARISDAVPTRKGYRFKGWNTQANGAGVSYHVGEDIDAVSSDMDLYAQWEYNGSEYRKIIYHANAECDSSICSLPSNTKISIGNICRISCSVPTRCCHYFVGWNTKVDGSGIWFSPGGMIVGGHDDLELYAIWQCC